jgi:hypothetical protein
MYFPMAPATMACVIASIAPALRSNQKSSATSGEELGPRFALFVKPVLGEGCAHRGMIGEAVWPNGA